MTDNLPTRRRRGGQPGNKNAKGNSGNRNPRPNIGNRGGKGAPLGNQFARKRPRSLAAALLAEYQDNPEVREWVIANGAALDCDKSETDAIDIAMHQGLIAEEIAARGKEFKFGLFTKPDFIELEDRRAA